jgi:hypothetical protein
MQGMTKTCSRQHQLDADIFSVRLDVFRPQHITESLCDLNTSIKSTTPGNNLTELCGAVCHAICAHKI